MYGKFTGIGTLIIAGGLVISAILNMVITASIVSLISSVTIIVTAAIGVIFILYAQFKYNKGIW